MALRILLIAIIIWYVVRYLVPALLGTSRNNDQDVNRAGNRQYRKSTREGDVTITDYGKRSKKVNPDKDDYVDYEEVD